MLEKYVYLNALSPEKAQELFRQGKLRPVTQQPAPQPPQPTEQPAPYYPEEAPQSQVPIIPMNYYRSQQPQTVIHKVTSDLNRIEKFFKAYR